MPKFIFHTDCDKCEKEFERDLAKDKTMHLCKKCNKDVWDFINGSKIERGKNQRTSKDQQRSFEAGASKKSPVNPDVRNPFVEKAEKKEV